VVFWSSCISGAIYGILSIWRWSLSQTYREGYFGDAIGILLSIISISFLHVLIFIELTWMFQIDQKYSLSMPISQLAKTFLLNRVLLLPRSVFTYGSVLGQIGELRVTTKLAGILINQKHSCCCLGSVHLLRRSHPGALMCLDDADSIGYNDYRNVFSRSSWYYGLYFLICPSHSIREFLRCIPIAHVPCLPLVGRSCLSRIFFPY